MPPLSMQSPLVMIGSLLVLALLGIVSVQYLGTRVNRLAKALSTIREGRRRQLLTLIQVLRWGLTVGIIIIAVLMVFSTLGVDITPVIAGAGVAGLAVSMAAQSFIKDLIGGVIILLENQFVVGEVITSGAITGTVERITLRVTYIRDFKGGLHTVPNGEIRVVTNLSRDWARAFIDLRIAPAEQIDRVLAVLQEVCTTFAEDEDYTDLLLDPPSVIGPLALEDQAFTVQVMFKTKPGKQWTSGRELRKRIHVALNNTGIKTPTMDVIVHQAQE